MLHDNMNGYGLIQIVLHWATAGLVAVLLPLGLWMTGLDYYDPWYTRAPDLHRAIGVLFGLILLARWAWRLTRAQPPILAANAREKTAAALVRRLLYLVPLCLVISGYLISTADGRTVDVFGWFSVPATLQGIEGQADIAGDIHFALAMLLLALIVLHVLGALRHHFVYRDDTLRRMLRPQTPPNPVEEQ